MKTETPDFTIQNENKFLSSEEIALEIKTLENKLKNNQEFVKTQIAELERRQALKLEQIKVLEKELERRQTLKLEQNRVLEAELRRRESEESKLASTENIEPEKITEAKELVVTEEDAEKPDTVMVVAKDGNLSEVKLEDVKPELEKEVTPIRIPLSTIEGAGVSHIKTGLLDESEPWSQDPGMLKNRYTAKEKTKIYPEDPQAPYIVENIAKYTQPRNNKSLIKRALNWFGKTKEWVNENKKPLAIPVGMLAVATALGANEYVDITKGQNIRKETMQRERLGFEKIANWVKTSGKDTTIYNQFGGEAQMRFASIVSEDYQVEQRSKNPAPLSAEEIKQRENDPRVVQPETKIKIILMKIAGGDYTKPVQENTTIGAYAINMRAWGDTIDIPNGDGLWDLKEVHNKRYLQDQYANAIVQNLHAKYGDDMQKIFAGFLKPDTGPQDVGTPAGDVPFDESGMTVNKFVENAMTEYTKLNNATENGGRFIADKENQKLYFIDLNYKPTYETDVYEIEKGDALEAYTGVIESGKNTNYRAEQVQGFLHQMSKTIDYADYVATHKKLVSSEETTPGKVFEKNNEQRMSYVQDHPGEGQKLNPTKEEIKQLNQLRKMSQDQEKKARKEHEKRSRIIKKTKVNS